MPGRRKKPIRARRRRRAGRNRGRRLRLLAGLLSVLLVLAAGFTLYSYVAVTSRFEGRLWTLPSRVYSDTLVLRSGSALPPEALVARLDRCGFARSKGRPARPGQYRRAGAEIEVFSRPFESSSGAGPEGPVTIRFGRSRIRSIRSPDGVTVRRLELEPELLATMFGPRQEERVLVPLDEVPERFVRAVLAAEDSRFYQHIGLDVRAMTRAALANLRRGRIVQGGSTISQQTVKNLYLGQQRTWWRKIREIPMSLLLDLRYPKDRILEVYLNEVYLGQRGSVAVCGAQAAARFYFGRDLSDLSLGESALLAGLIRSPGRYNPFVNPERAIARRDQVLEAMRRLELIEQSELERAKAEELQLGSGSGGFSRAPYAVDFAAAQLAEQYPARVLAEEGLRIHTTIDTSLQESAEQALGLGLARLEREAPLVVRQREQRTLQGAIVVLDPSTGAVLAMVGGRDYGGSQFNRAVQARRQPGSCFKPFVYAAAFERALENETGGLTPASVLDDSPIELVSGGRLWRPENYDGVFRGPVTVRRALERSLNVPTIRAARQVGLDRVVDLAKRAGLTSELSPLPSLALGTLEVTPLELAGAYATLAGQGVRVQPLIVREVRDASGAPIERREAQRRKAIDPRAAFLTTHVLQGVFEHGTARTALQYGFSGRAAGKTGTTDETRDAWFVGFTPDVLGLVWVGYDDNARTGLTGATGALPIWAGLMKRAGLAHSAARFETPAGIIERRIDPSSGGLAVAGCPETIREMFAVGTEPTARCSTHRRGFVNWLRKLRARRR